MWGWEKPRSYYGILPGAIGDVFLSQENRPEAMDYLTMVLTLMFEPTSSQKNGGRTFWHICSCLSVSLQVTALQAAQALSVLGFRWKRYLPANTCHLSRSCSRSWVTRTCRSTQTRRYLSVKLALRWLERGLWILGTDVQMHIMDLPWAMGVCDLLEMVEKGNW